MHFLENAHCLLVFLTRITRSPLALFLRLRSSTLATAKASAFLLNRAVSGISFITKIPSDGQ